AVLVGRSLAPAHTAMALVTRPGRRFLRPRRRGHLRDPRLARFVPWDSIGASRDSGPSRFSPLLETTGSPGVPWAFFHSPSIGGHPSGGPPPPVVKRSWRPLLGWWRWEGPTRRAQGRARGLLHPRPLPP